MFVRQAFQLFEQVLVWNNRRNRLALMIGLKHCFRINAVLLYENFAAVAVCHVRFLDLGFGFLKVERYAQILNGGNGGCLVQHVGKFRGNPV